MNKPPTNAEQAKRLKEMATEYDEQASQKEVGGVAETYPSARKLRADAQRFRVQAQKLEGAPDTSA